MSSEAPSGGPAIAVAGVGKCYEIYPRPIDRLKQALWRGRRRFYREFWALRDVSFDVQVGEAVAVIGRNGSGKSTLLEIIGGTLTPTVGQVRTVGRVAALLELGAGFNPEFTGRENVFLNGAILGLSRPEMRERFDAIAAFADIGDFIDQPVKTYSTGMVVRLAFAVQAQIDPEILIVDEALAVGDEMFQRKCYARLDQLRSQGTAVVLVTHSAAAVERYCDRAVLLEAGRAHGIGPSKQIVDQYHALLFADEEAYARITAAPEAPEQPMGDPRVAAPAGTALAEPVAADELAAKAPPDVFAPEPPSLPGEGTPAPQLGPGQRCRALIESVWIRDATGRPRDFFDSGEEIEIGFSVLVGDPIHILQAGVRIKTVEGVEAYGTSTAYVDASLKDVPARSRCVARARLTLSLGAGTYFVSVAVGETLSVAEMAYLDKRADVLMFHVRQHPLTGTGIADLLGQFSFDILGNCREIAHGAAEAEAGP